MNIIIDNLGSNLTHADVLKLSTLCRCEWAATQRKNRILSKMWSNVTLQLQDIYFKMIEEQDEKSQKEKEKNE
jgi:hypothetical protein